MKRLVLTLMAVCLCFAMTCSALAAPARDIQQADIEVDPGMKMLAETVLGAAVFTRTTGLEAGMIPSPALVESAFALGLYNLSLPHDGADLLENKPTLSSQEIQDLYGLLFVSGGYALPQVPSVAGVTRVNDGLTFDLSILQDAPMIGVYIYSAVVDEASGGADADAADPTIELMADLYSYYGDFSTDAYDLPEDALTWLCNAEIALKPAPDTAYGYRVERFALSDGYEDGMLSEWQDVENTAYEYSVNLPAILGLAEDDPAHWAWQTADGSATVRIDVENQNHTADQVMALWLSSHPGREVMQQTEFNTFYSTGEGAYDLWIISSDLPVLYHLSMQFPPERQAEYTLYSEFIRNSMIVWGISNG
ncbi:MAG: hypothetical protein IJ189_05515 [Clostridia bacterium]|nr:hypothetical protein [Clostridia bacterium]